MSGHFVKIYGAILKSSVWGESKDVRILWVTMLADADSTGFVESSTSGLARMANLSVAETQAALKVLEAPDLESKSQRYGGRRIEKVEGGWQLLNYQEYRDRRTEAQIKRAERQRRWREKKRAEEHPTAKYIPVAVRQEVWARDNGACQACGSTERIHFDHIVPVSKGGESTPSNLQLLCQSCNLEKGTDDTDHRASTVDDRNAQRGEGRGERGERSQGEIRTHGESQTGEDRPASETPNLPVKRGSELPAPRDQKWVQAFIEKLSAEDWSRGRARKEAVVAFQFHRWIAGVKNRTVFSPQRERVATKLIEQYGLVRVMFAIVGQRTHPDFNQADHSYLGWDNLFRKEKGYAAIEKCADHALAREGAAKKVLRALKQLQEERGWSPSEADRELFDSIGGTE